MDRTTGGVKQKGKYTRGETLVETLVAFAVLMILLSMVTTAVRAGIAMNNHASASINAQEAASLLVETDGGTALGEPDAALLISLAAETRVGDGTAQVEAPLQTKQTAQTPEGASLYYFTGRGGA